MPERLNINDIRIDGGTQSRAAINHDTVQEYSDAMVDGEDLCSGRSGDPVTVFYDGSSYWLADGFHRLEAAKVACWLSIDVEVRQGTQRDAILYSVGANGAHGLRRTNADKRRAVEVLLNDEEWKCWSNSEIARRCGVDEKTVRNIKEITHFGNSEVTERTYTTKHGSDQAESM
jgi:hypothetical protein